MARRKGNSLEVAVIQVIALVGLGIVCSPVLRGVFLWLVILIAAGLLFLVVYRLTGRRLVSVQGGPATLFVAPPLTTVSPAPKRQAKIEDLDWFQFEKLMEAVYQQQGYAVERRGGANPDGGIDLVLSKDGIRSAVQCKHWKSWKVGVKQIRELLGALADSGIQNGIFVTLQQYTPPARTCADRNHIQLVGQSELMLMLEAVNWEQNPAITAILNDNRKVCPKCESVMVLRPATKGRNIGQRFWGCSTFPRCKYTAQES